MKQMFKHSVFLLILILQMSAGCAARLDLTQDTAFHVYTSDRSDDTLINWFAPVFGVHHYGTAHNRIGMPEAQPGDQIIINPDVPVIFYETHSFTAENGVYTNLIYRVHFQEVPFSLVPFYITYGKNPGLFVIITLNSDHNPVLVTTVGTCGCYLSIIPTTFLHEEAYPDNWDKHTTLKVYGERLPPFLDFEKTNNARLLISVRPDVHRVMDLVIISDNEHKSAYQNRHVTSRLIHMEYLKKIPINGHETSFFHEKGWLKGFVKDSIKPWEMLLLSWISLDLFVGSDKVYGNTEETGNPFYTSLKPWNRNASDMNNFAEFLKFWGWNL